MDLNLLTALDCLLTEGSVVAAAEKMHLSPSAMSRTLGRIREELNDPVLVRAGRKLVPTPRAEALRESVREVVERANSLLRSGLSLDLETLEKTFVIRASDGFVAQFGSLLLERLHESAPLVRVVFAPEGQEDVEALREGRVDLDIGVAGQTGPEIRIQRLFRDHYVGVVRNGHPLSRGRMTLRKYAEAGHIGVSRRGRLESPIDRELESRGYRRRVVAVVASFGEVMSIVRASDLVAAVPYVLAGVESGGVHFFPLPVSTDVITVSHMWHPRLEADPAHIWLRQCVREIVRSVELPG